MREIKFKGKSIMTIDELDDMQFEHDEGWFIGNLVMKGETPYIVGDFIEVDQEYTINEFWVQVHPESVGQWTGLNDKNGTPVYENDIDTDEHGNLSVVKYIKSYGAYCFVPIELYLHEDYEEEVHYHYGYDCFFHNVTPNVYADIIGNIYENPELLETGENG